MSNSNEQLFLFSIILSDFPLFMISTIYFPGFPFHWLNQFWQFRLKELWDLIVRSSGFGFFGPKVGSIKIQKKNSVHVMGNWSFDKMSLFPIRLYSLWHFSSYGFKKLPVIGTSRKSNNLLNYKIKTQSSHKTTK